MDALVSHPRQGHVLYGAHAHIEADLGFGELTVIPAWRRASIDAIVSGSPFGFQQRERDEQASVEARLAGRNGPLDWLAGTFLFDESIKNDTLVNLSSILAQSKQRYDTFSRALFGTVSVDLSDGLRFGGGLRWTIDRKRYDSAGTTLSIICQGRIDNRPSCPTLPLFPLTEDFSQLPFDVPSQPGTSLPILVDGGTTQAILSRSELAARGRLTDRAVTWRVGGEADLGPRTLAYASIETGYRPGGFNTAVGFETYDPERIKAYTLGLRHRGWNETVQLDLEAFWWNYRDQQVSSLRPDLSMPPQNANITDNIGNSRTRGLEVDVRVRPQLNTQLRAIVQYLDANYRSFSYVQLSPGAPPLTGCATAISTMPNLYTVDCAAKQPYNSPRWSMSLEARQSFVLKDIVLTALAGTQFRSARNIGFAFLPEQRIAASWTSHAQFILSPRNGAWEAAIFIRNIEGDRIPQFMIYHPVSNALVAATSPPRVFGLRLSARMGGAQN